MRFGVPVLAKFSTENSGHIHFVTYSILLLDWFTPMLGICLVNCFHNLNIFQQAPEQRRRHGILSGGDESSVVWPTYPKNTAKSDKEPDLGHFVLKSGGYIPS